MGESKPFRKRGQRGGICLKLHNLVEQPAETGGGGAGRKCGYLPWAQEVDTHEHICLRAEGPGGPRRTLPDSAHSGRPLCCAGNAGSGQTGGHSCPRHWGPHSRCIGTAGRAGGPQRAPAGPQKSHHHRSHIAALGRERCVWRSRHEERQPVGPTAGQGAREREPASLLAPCGAEHGLRGQADLRTGPSSAVSWLWDFGQATNSGPLSAKWGLEWQLPHSTVERVWGDHVCKAPGTVPDMW